MLKEKLDWGEVESRQMAMNVKAAIFIVTLIKHWQAEIDAFQLRITKARKRLEG